LNVDQLLRQRLSNQHLAGPPFAEPAEVVAWLGAVQSQDYGGAKWALAQRLKHASDAALDQAFNDGAILRTHVMRPTWHFVAPADVRWLLALTAPRVRAVLGHYDLQWGVDADVRKRSRAVLTQALQGGQALTRAELDRALKAAGIHLTALGRTHVVMHAELDGLIVSGPRRGKQFTYMLLEERVPPASALSRDEALAELVRRYFTSHGPALVADFAWWSGLTAADARRGLHALGGQLASETVEDKTYWFAPSALPAPSVPGAMPRSALLLPNYDEYAVAYRDRDAFFDPALAAGLDPRTSAPFSNVIVIRGRVAGFWTRTLVKRSVVIGTRWLRPPAAAEQRAVEAAARRYAKFLGLPVRIT
jgi:hypothetical protein